MTKFTIDPLDNPELDISVEVDVLARVILFNDEEHTFEEVISQLIRATGCSLATARSLTTEVHSRGKAMVYEGEVGSCLKVSSILEEIELNTQIEY